MKSDSKQFLFDLLTTPSVSGYEEHIQAKVRERMEQYADSVETDLHGNVIVGTNIKAKRRVMLAGHCDQIGMVVTNLDKDGFIRVTNVGGLDKQTLPGSVVHIVTSKGQVPGVIGRKSFHIQTKEERGKPIKSMNNIWIDIGAKSQKDAEKVVGIGDPIVYKPEVTELRNDIIAGPGIDNRVGLFVVMEALRLCAKRKLNVALYSVSTVQEELGLRGARTAAFSVDPEVGIGVDVTHATDYPTVTESNLTPVSLGDGAVVYRGPNINPVVYSLFQKSAKKAKIPYQIKASGRSLGNDTNTIQINRRGVATGSIAIPNRHMHTQIEECHLKDLDNCVKLLVEFVASIKPSTSFIP